MLVKCICTNCAGHLEFEQENAGEKIDCPHCGFETTLFLPGDEPEHPLLLAALRRRRRRRLIAAGVGVLLVAGAGYALYRWGLPLIQDQFPSVESRLVQVLLLLLACAVAVLGLCWAVFPVVLFFQVRKLNSQLAQLLGATTSVGPEEEPATEEEIEPEPELEAEAESGAAIENPAAGESRN